MALVTPARLGALTWVGLAAVLALVVDGALPWALYSDAYSPSPLPEDRACELVTTALSAMGRFDCAVVHRDELTMVAEATPREGALVADGLPVTLCFLKARRWFIVDWFIAVEGRGAACPSSPPEELPRITSADDELRVERRWTDTMLQRRREAERAALHTTLVEVAEQTRGADEPTPCPAFSKGRVMALDVDLLRKTGNAWHFLSDEQLEDALSDRKRVYPGEPPLSSFVLLLSLHERQLPVGQRTGVARGSVALVDWRRKKVLCEAPFDVTQPENAPRDLSRPDVLMPDFKERCAEALATTVRRLGGGALQVDPTY